MEQLNRYYCEICKGEERTPEEIRPNPAGAGSVCYLCHWPVTEKPFPAVPPAPWEARYYRHGGMTPARSEIGVNLGGRYGEREVVATLGGNYADALHIVRCVNAYDGLMAALAASANHLAALDAWRTAADAYAGGVGTLEALAPLAVARDEAETALRAAIKAAEGQAGDGL